MAYQVKRRGIYTSELELTEEDGTVVHTLHVEIDPDSMVKKLSEKHVALIRAMQDLETASGSGATVDEKLAVIGQSVKDLFEAVFGNDGAQTIIAFYNARYIEMCQEVLPFITQEVIPQVRKLAQESKKQVMQSYNRKPRRLFGGK